MPLKDQDGGLVWQGYDPRLFTGKLPKEQYVSRPFYHGGSEVPLGLNAPQLSSNITSKTRGSKNMKNPRRKL